MDGRALLYFAKIWRLIIDARRIGVCRYGYMHGYLQKICGYEYRYGCDIYYIPGRPV